jgi:hypothetical protein
LPIHADLHLANTLNQISTPLKESLIDSHRAETALIGGKLANQSPKDFIPNNFGVSYQVVNLRTANRRHVFTT